jgi:hypothetical protein
MASGRIVALSAVLTLLAAAPAHAVEPRPGVLLKGEIEFPRAQSMSLRTGMTDGSKLSVSMGFDGKCSGGRLRELWASNVRATPTVRAQEGTFAASLQGTVKNVGGVRGRTGVFEWRFTGEFVKRDVVKATVTGTASVRAGRRTIARCKIAKPADVRLSVR